MFGENLAAVIFVPADATLVEFTGGCQNIQVIIEIDVSNVGEIRAWPVAHGMTAEVLIPIVFEPGDTVIRIESANHILISIRIKVNDMECHGSGSIARYRTPDKILIAIVLPPVNIAAQESRADDIGVFIAVHIHTLDTPGAIIILSDYMLNKTGLSLAT
jgi:hypothetical protein